MAAVRHAGMPLASLSIIPWHNRKTSAVTAAAASKRFDAEPQRRTAASGKSSAGNPGFARHPRPLRLAQNIDEPERAADLEQQERQADRDDFHREQAGNEAGAPPKPRWPPRRTARCRRRRTGNFPSPSSPNASGARVLRRACGPFRLARPPCLPTSPAPRRRRRCRRCNKNRDLSRSPRACGNASARAKAAKHCWPAHRCRRRCRASAMQALTQAGVARGSTPGTKPFSIPKSMRSEQNVHFCATPRRGYPRARSRCSSPVP